jgi:hypothetical protein
MLQQFQIVPLKVVLIVAFVAQISVIILLFPHHQYQNLQDIFNQTSTKSKELESGLANMAQWAY